VHEIVDQRVDALDLLRPEAARALQRRPALELAFLADHLRELAELLGHRHVLLDQVVEYFGHLAEARAAVQRQLGARVALSQRDQRAVNLGHLLGVGYGGDFVVFQRKIHAQTPLELKLR
jgi:hypothetical protein